MLPDINMKSPAPGRDVAQPGSASHWGCGGRRFESSRPDQFFRDLAEISQSKDHFSTGFSTGKFFTRSLPNNHVCIDLLLFSEISVVKPFYLLISRSPIKTKHSSPLFYCKTIYYTALSKISLNCDGCEQEDIDEQSDYTLENGVGRIDFLRQ